MYNPKDDPPDHRWCKEMKGLWRWVQKTIEQKHGRYKIGNTNLSSRNIFIDYCFSKVVEKVKPCNHLFNDEQLQEFQTISEKCYQSERCSWNEYRDIFLSQSFIPCKLLVVSDIFSEVSDRLFEEEYETVKKKMRKKRKKRSD